MTYTYIIIALLSLACIFLGYYCIKFALILLRVQDAIEEAIDVMDGKYQKMSEILKRPLFFDSPEVRSVLEDINYTRTAVHNVAVSLVNNFEANKDDER